jgi:hypothetical protein
VPFSLHHHTTLGIHMQTTPATFLAWILLLLAPPVTLRAADAERHATTASQGGVSIALPQQVALTPPLLPNLISEGGFENVRLDADTQPETWRTFS